MLSLVAKVGVAVQRGFVILSIKLLIQLQIYIQSVLLLAAIDPIALAVLILAPAFFIPTLVSLDIWRRSKLGLGSNALAIEVEDERHGNEQCCYRTEKRKRIVDAHTLEHVSGEEGEDSAKQTSHDGVGCNG